MLYINVGADALIGPTLGLFGEQALRLEKREDSGFLLLKRVVRGIWRVGHLTNPRNIMSITREP